MRARILVLIILLSAGCGGVEPADPPSTAQPNGRDLLIPEGPPPGPEYAPTDEPDEVRYKDSRFFIAHDMFLPTDDPPTVSAADARFLNDNDQVLGFVINGRARAYSVQFLSFHHVVNDHIGDTPLAVTY